MPDDRITATRAEVTGWFFEDYLPRWVAAAAGTSAEGPEFIHGYWGTPMHVTALDQSFWCLDDASVRGFLELNSIRRWPCPTVSGGTRSPCGATASRWTRMCTGRRALIPVPRCLRSCCVTGGAGAS